MYWPTSNFPAHGVCCCDWSKRFPRFSRAQFAFGGRVDLVVRALAFHQCGPGSIFRTRCHMWIEFVGSFLCQERFFAGYSGFPLSSKTNIWFDLICEQ